MPTIFLAGETTHAPTWSGLGLGLGLGFGLGLGLGFGFGFGLGFGLLTLSLAHLSVGILGAEGGEHGDRHEVVVPADVALALDRRGGIARHADVLILTTQQRLAWRACSGRQDQECEPGLGTRPQTRLRLTASSERS